MSFRRFNLRGQAGADLEWRLISFAYNLRKLSRDEGWRQKIRQCKA